MKSNLAVIESDSVIASMTKASYALAEAVSISQTKTIIDVARAAEIYAKRQHLSESAINQATSVKVEAMRKLGEILKATPKATGTAGMGRPSLGGAKTEPPKSDAPTLDELGLTKKESALAQKLADLPEEAFEQVRTGAVTMAKAVAVVKEKKEKEKKKKKKELPQPEPGSESANDDGPTLAELVDELQAENTRLTAEITALVEADDQKAETIKWHRMYDHAMRSQSEAMTKAAAQQKEAKRLGNIVRECCRALSLEDPRLLLAEVKRLAERVEAA